MLEMLKQCTMSTVIVKAIHTMSREIVNVAFLKLGRLFTFLDVVRDFTYLDVAVFQESPSDGNAKCTACGTVGDSVRGSVLRQRSALYSGLYLPAMAVSRRLRQRQDDLCIKKNIYSGPGTIQYFSG